MFGAAHNVMKYKMLRYNWQKILIVIILIIHEIVYNVYNDKNYVILNGNKIQNFIDFFYIHNSHLLDTDEIFKTFCNVYIFTVVDCV